MFPFPQVYKEAIEFLRNIWCNKQISFSINLVSILNSIHLIILNGFPAGCIITNFTSTCNWLIIIATNNIYCLRTNLTGKSTVSTMYNYKLLYNAVLQDEYNTLNRRKMKKNIIISHATESQSMSHSCSSNSNC